MKYDIVLCCVGGQGVLSLSQILLTVATKQGLFSSEEETKNEYEVRQSEIHGMSQRGGSVVVFVRISDKKIHSNIIAKGSANMIISLELLEGLRYLSYLNPNGLFLTANTMIKNMPNYPDEQLLLEQIKKIEKHEIKDTRTEAKVPKTDNMVILGAVSKYLPFTPKSYEEAIKVIFAKKGQQVIQNNIEAFLKGRE